MEKLLTISVAAYNMENYIENCLDSLIESDVLDALEVFIIDDGGKDNTLDIARKYEERYPNTFHTIHKENGGYGSTVNYSIAYATGKYFKLLDGDDWFDGAGLSKLVGQLQRMDNPDIILNRYYRVQPEVEATLDNPHDWFTQCDKCIPVGEINYKLTPGMWGMTVKTEIIKGQIPDMLEHTLYTDQLFVVYSLSKAQSILFQDYPVYCYRLGRDGQSVSKEARIKHYKETMKVMKCIAKYYSECSSETKRFLLPRVSLYYRYAIMTILLAPSSNEMYKEIREIESWLKNLDMDLYKKVGKSSKRIMLIRILKKIGYSYQAGGVLNWA